MAYSINNIEVITSESDCDNVVFEITIQRATTDSPLSRLEVISPDGQFINTLDYPSSFIEANEVENNGVVTYTLKASQQRTSYSSFLFKIVFLNLNTFEDDIRINIFAPSWKISEIDVQVTPSGIGTATAILTKLNDQPITNFELSNLSFETSLNDLDFFGTRTITGLDPDDYTIYIRDSYGCKKSTTFTVESNEVGGNFVFVSQLNSVVFARRNALRRNNENELSYENTTDTNYKSWTNKYPVNQSLRFQYQSSFLDNKVFLIKDDVLTEITIQNLTDYRNQKDIRDGYVTYIPATQNGMLVNYPIGGNVYNENGDIIAENTLEGGLLSENIIGSYINVEGFGELEIINITNNVVRGQLMELNYTSQSSVIDTLKITTSLSPANDFDYFEFNVNFNAEGCYQIAICDSNDFDELNPLNSVKYLSERIEITDQLEEHHLIKWSNDENNQIAWSTGIESEIYVPYVMPPTFEPEGENDVYMTDTRQRLLEAESYENYNFHFDLLPLSIVRQLQLGLSSSNLIIDDLNYVKKETAEVESLDGSNLYQMTPKLAKSTNYNSNSNENEFISGGGSAVIDSKGILKLN